MKRARRRILAKPFESRRAQRAMNAGPAQPSARARRARRAVQTDAAFAHPPSGYIVGAAGLCASALRARPLRWPAAGARDSQRRRANACALAAALARHDAAFLCG